MFYAIESGLIGYIRYGIYSAAQQHGRMMQTYGQQELMRCAIRKDLE